MLNVIAATVCFVVCHVGPADHFATFAEHLSSRGFKVEVFASGPALAKLQERKIEHLHRFDLEDSQAIDVAKKCSSASVVITDVGHLFDVKIQEALQSEASNSLRLAYYDNPESFVPGGYSETAAKVMNAAQGVLFANANLVDQVDVGGAKKQIGLGYYPISKAEDVARRRLTEAKTIREQLFLQNGLEERGQKILVYAGGNNDEYFNHAFPAFLSFCDEVYHARSGFVNFEGSQNDPGLKDREEGNIASILPTSDRSKMGRFDGPKNSPNLTGRGIDLSDYVVVLQQHPGAKGENRDAKLLGQNSQKIIVSTMSSEDAQVVADAILYYQTSMGPQFVFAGIAAMQVGHQVYKDILVRSNACLVATSKEQFAEALESLSGGIDFKKAQEVVKAELGILPNWRETLESLVEKGD